MTLENCVYVSRIAGALAAVAAFIYPALQVRHSRELDSPLMAYVDDILARNPLTNHQELVKQWD